jgi:hypothetical protein
MKKFILSILLFSVLYAYGQDYSSENPESSIKRNIISLDGGTLISNMGIAQGFIINAGYESLIIPQVGVQAIVNGWFMNMTSLGVTTLFNLHVLGNFAIDPYIGLGVCYLKIFNNNTTLFDIPAVVGVNAMFNKYFGFKLQGKFYLLSIAYMLTEINIGIVIVFDQI